MFFFARNRVRRSNNATAEKFTVLSCAAGEVKKIYLPDGSSVWLNSRSRMRISDDFQVKDSRNVFLDQGEAFFEVTKNPRRPFFVITPSVTTRVLGTSFNVKAYKELTNAVVTVATGRVQVKGGSRILAVLTRGQQVSYNTLTQKFELATVDPESAHQWMNGEYTLNQAGFNELAFAINNLYGYKLVSTDPASNHYKYSLRLKSARTLEETIKIICSVHQNHYRRSKNEVIITK
nr:FecR family protein [Mucilaginibacter straminoryzae]